MVELAHAPARYGRAALVTGAASGIGAAFARRLAQAGFEVHLVDRDAAALGRTARAIEQAGSSKVHVAVGDLTDPTFLARLEGWPEEHEFGVLVHSAGISPMGRFLDLDRGLQLRAIDLHCRASLALAHAYGLKMRERRRGAIVLLSSNSAFLRAPLIANYAATKSYTLSLAQALWEELREDGIDVLGLAPGMTFTPLLTQSRPALERARPFIERPEDVVDGALAALGRQPIYIPTVVDRLAAGFFERILPRRAAMPLARRALTYFYPHLED